jgi:hypothetical protein
VVLPAWRGPVKATTGKPCISRSSVDLALREIILQIES